MGLDDTDSPDQGGTGRVARELADFLICRMDGILLGVSRHRLLQDYRVPCTRKNQASCVVLQFLQKSTGAILPWVREEVRRRAVAGSDPGICVATFAQVTPAILEFGKRVQYALVHSDDAIALAEREGLVLEALGGTGDGVIGALAAVGLRASGNDGRITRLGRIRELSGVLPVSTLTAAGSIAQVCDLGGTPLPLEALVDTGGKVRPWLRGGQPVLVVEPAGDGLWRPVRKGS